MFCRTIKVIFAVALTACVSSCEADQVSTVVVATSCFVIEVDEQREKAFDYGRQLAPDFGRFALEQGLTTPDKESPGGAYDYRNPAEGVLITLTLGMGERRAATALYTDQERDCPICQAFEEFMRGNVGKDFKVIPCDEIEGFRMPKLYNVDLRKP